MANIKIILKKLLFILLLFPIFIIGQFSSDSLSNVRSIESSESPEKLEEKALSLKAAVSIRNNNLLEKILGIPQEIR